jgi:hypothetical protein
VARVRELAVVRRGLAVRVALSYICMAVGFGAGGGTWRSCADAGGASGQ